MLVRNTSKLILQVELELYFDDGTTKREIVGEGDIIRLIFRRNYKKVDNVGVVRGITTTVNQKRMSVYGKDKINTCLIMDFSEDFESKHLLVPVDDILDFEMVTKVGDIPRVIGKPCFDVTEVSSVDYAGVGIARILDE